MPHVQTMEGKHRVYNCNIGVLTLAGGVGQRLSNFSVAVIEVHNQGSLRKKEFILTYDFRGIKSI